MQIRPLKVWRAWRFEVAYALKDLVIWNIEVDMKLSGTEIRQTELKLSQFYQWARKFMKIYELPIFPVNQVPPFHVKQRYVAKINGVKIDTYTYLTG